MDTEGPDSEDTPMKNTVEISSDMVVKVEKLPEKEFARVQTSPQPGSMVERFEGMFYR